MSRVLSELCTLLVNDIYGGLTSRVYGTILRHGRSNISSIQHWTRLSLRQIKHALTVLIQQHLVFWYSSSTGDATIYEANTSAAYSVLWCGRYVQVAEDRYGGFAGAIISHLLLSGHARVGDLAQADHVGTTKDDPSHMTSKLAESSKHTAQILDNSHGDDAQKSVMCIKIEEMLCEILDAGLISVVHEADFRSDADNCIEAEKLLPKLDDYNAKSKKDKSALREMELRAKLVEWKLGTKREREEISNLVTERQRKRRLNDDDEVVTTQKRRKTHSQMDLDGAFVSNDSAVVVDGALNLNTVLRINRDKYTIILRNEHLIKLVEKALGKATSTIYARFLRHIEQKLKIHEEEAPDDEEDVTMLPQISTYELAALLPKSLDLVDALAQVDPNMIRNVSLDRRKRRRKESGSDGEPALTTAHTKLGDSDASSSGFSGDEHTSDSTEATDDSDSEDDNDESARKPNGHAIETAPTGDTHLEAVRQHLLLLAHHPDHYLYRIRPAGSQAEKWAINYRALMRTVKLQLLLDTVTSRYGASSARLVRICSERGRLDDKTLCTLSLIAQKEMRTRLLTLKKAGVLQLQEVPRDNARVASRTTFLYFLDEAKYSSKLVDECYKTAVRCLQRLDVEKMKISGVLEKVDRSDIKGREDEFLGAKEKEALGRWHEVEDRIWGEIMRVDNVVCILRDF